MKIGHDAMKNMQVRVDEISYKRYRNLATDLGLTISDMIEKALKEYADYNEAILNSKRKEDSDQGDKTDSEDADGGQEFDN